MRVTEPAKDTLRADRSERSVLLTLVLVAAAEVFCLAWLLH
jgi:hypothetical protein